MRKTICFRAVWSEFDWYIKSMTRTPNKIMTMDQKKMDINEAHAKLGHPCKRTTRLTVESYGWTTTGKFKPYDACLKDKAIAKDVSHKPSKVVASSFAWVTHLKAKSDVPEVVEIQYLAPLSSAIALL
jgi:hypothetical protein